MDKSGLMELQKDSFVRFVKKKPVIFYNHQVRDVPNVKMFGIAPENVKLKIGQRINQNALPKLNKLIQLRKQKILGKKIKCKKFKSLPSQNWIEYNIYSNNISNI